MNCDEIENVLMNPGANRPERDMEAVREHIQTCSNCERLSRIVDMPTSNPHLDPAQLERLEKLIVRRLKPVHQLAPSWILILAFFAAFALLSYIGVLYLGPRGWFLLMPVQKVTIFATLAASASLLTFSLVRQMVPGQKALLPSGLLPAGVFVLLCLAVASVFQVRAEKNFIQNGEACLKVGIPYAIPAGIVFWLILRRGAILSPRAVGAIAGMLAGLVSTTILEVHCPNLDLWHILFWHVGIALLGLLAGLLLASLGQVLVNRRT